MSLMTYFTAAMSRFLLLAEQLLFLGLLSLAVTLLDKYL